MILGLIHGISALRAADRGNSADAVTDVVQDLPEQEADLLPRLLVMVRLIEPNSNCRESQLRALAELAGWHAFPSTVLTPLVAIRGEAVGSEIEYLDYLLDHPKWPRSRDQSPFTGRCCGWLVSRMTHVRTRSPNQLPSQTTTRLPPGVGVSRRDAARRRQLK